jgi:hypothetical protein
MSLFKNKIMKKIISAAMFVLILVSCNNQLDLSPLSQISDNSFWRAPSDFQLAANALYPLLDGPSFNDNMSDIAIGVTNDPHSDGTLVIPTTSSLWTNEYSNIRTANNILQHAKLYNQNNGDISEYIGEAYFFRAYFYFDLYKTYGGVPLITKVLDDNDKMLYSSRASRKQTVDFIINDLDSAMVKLPSKSTLSSDEVGRISKEGAEAFKARVALFEGTWNKFNGGGGTVDDYLSMAVQAAKDVMNSGQYSLYTGMGAQSYRYLFIDQGNNSPESIIDYKINYQVNQNGFGWYSSYGYSSPTKKLADMYLSNNGLPISNPNNNLFQGYNTFTSEYQNRDPRMTMTILVPGDSIVGPTYLTPVPWWPGQGGNRNARTGYMPYKFITETALENSAWAQSNFDWHILRYAEVLLIYAESTFELNGNISDQDLNISINKLRDRVGMPHLTNAFVTANGLDMRTEIRRERTIELALECFRYDDIRRWGTAINELDAPLRGVKLVNTSWASQTPFNVPGGYVTDANGFIVAESGSARIFSQKDYLDPIPTQEIQLNPNLTQNPGW